MDDLVKRLRERDKNRVGFFGPMPYNRDAEEAIALLEAQAALIAEARQLAEFAVQFNGHEYIAAKAQAFLAKLP